MKEILIIRFEIHSIINNGSWCCFLKVLFQLILVLKGFCETTTEPQMFFIELRKECNKCQNLVYRPRKPLVDVFPKVFFLKIPVN